MIWDGEKRIGFSFISVASFMKSFYKLLLICYLVSFNLRFLFLTNVGFSRYGVFDNSSAWEASPPASSGRSDDSSEVGRISHFLFHKINGHLFHKF